MVKVVCNCFDTKKLGKNDQILKLAVEHFKGCKKVGVNLVRFSRLRKKFQNGVNSWLRNFNWITVSLNDTSLEMEVVKHHFSIPYKNIFVEREGKKLTLKVQMDNRELLKLIPGCMDQFLKKDSAAYGICKAINEAKSEEEKLRLVDFLLDWANRNNLVNEVIGELCITTPNLKDFVDKTSLQIGEISI